MCGVDFEAVKQQITIYGALKLLGWEWSHIKGHQARGPCPVHGSGSTKSRSLAVDLLHGSWYCHSCKRGGSVIDLWAAVHGLPIYEAAVALCHAVGLPVPFLPRRSSRLPVPFVRTVKRNGQGDAGGCPPAP